MRKIISIAAKEAGWLLIWTASGAAIALGVAALGCLVVKALT